MNRTFEANLEYYKVFYYVAKTGTMTGAADLLCLTQPTVTTAVRRLEEQLGASLFARTRRGVTLTREGQTLWDRVEPAMQLLLSGEQELEDMRGLRGGTLSIASTEMSFRTYVLPVLERFVQDYPQIKVRLRNDLTDPILNMLRAGEIDLAILHSPFAVDERLTLHHIGEIEECFVAGPRYAARLGRAHTITELAGVPLISVPEGANTKDFAAELFRQEGLRYEPDIEVTTIELVVESVLRGLGIAMLPWSRAQEYVARGEMIRIPVSLSSPRRTAYAVLHRDMAPSPAARAFLSLLLPEAIRNAQM